MSDHPSFDCIVVGAGLAGLTAAAFLARAGQRVALLDKSDADGGRARTHVEQGFHLNLGPHALYRNGAALRSLHELGIHPSGNSPAASGAYAILAERKHALPAGPVSLLSTGLLGLAGKLEVARLLATFARIDAARHDYRSVREWLDTNIADPTARALVQALFRLTSYVNAPDKQSAGANLRQLQAALADSVLYVDGGWQTVVDALRHLVLDSGAELRPSSRVESIDHRGGHVTVCLGNGDALHARHVVLAVDPDTVRRLLPGSPAIDSWLGDPLPVEAACLDLALDTLPRPRATFALGIDRPLYFSVHTAAAKLAPAPNQAVVHALLYRPDDEEIAPRDAEAELERLVDLLQPGWREHVAHRRFLPRMTVTHGAPIAARGGLGGRPTVAVPDHPRLFVAGDWVGATGMLADASIASARTAAEFILSSRTQTERAAA